MYTEFFLGANSRGGFFSHYDALIAPESARRVFVIKGSPGCGKSSFMRRVEKAAAQAGYDIELIKCSSDPDSLDGVVIPALGAALVDGTAPHVVEPKYPIAVERYLDLSVCGDAHAIGAQRDTIIGLFDRYKSFYKRAYRMTGCAGALSGELTDIALGAADTEKLRRKALGIASREIKGTGAGAGDTPRFLSAISPKGYVTLFDTVRKLCRRVYVLEDTCSLASFMLTRLKESALKAQYRVISCYSPLVPERIEHLIIPELGLGFVTSNKLHEYPYDYARRCRIDATLSGEILKPKKQKFNFTRKLYHAMLDEACAALGEAKSAHDELEAAYNPHIDFDRVYAMADDVIAELLG